MHCHVRIIIVALLLLLMPTMAIVFYKNYLQYHELHGPEEKTASVSGAREVLFFNASWCGPCRRMKPIVTQLRRQGYHLRDLDVDRNRSLAEKYGVRGIPTFVFLQNGAEVHRFSGGTSADRLRKLCASYR
jgi:thioredoxin-like negative regulator of GroEL